MKQVLLVTISSLISQMFCVIIYVMPKICEAEQYSDNKLNDNNLIINIDGNIALIKVNYYEI